jgi:hypothetical protein
VNLQVYASNTVLPGLKYNPRSVDISSQERLMRKTAITLSAVLAAATVVWAGGDVWKSKSMDQWSDKDINEILQNSPWSKPNLQPQGAWHPDGQVAATGSTGIAGSKSDISHTAAGAAPGQNGATEKEDSAMANQATYSVFWWSARTIRAASMRRAVLKGAMSEADAEKAVATSPDDYMVLVQGTNMQLFQHRGEDAFLKSGYIQPKSSKEKIYPTKVSFLKGPDGQSVTGAVFYFPKKGTNGDATISAGEKEIDFYLLLGESKLITYFDPRKMVDSKGEDL